METKLTYEEAKARHPEQVEKVLWVLRKSRSKGKNAAPEDLEWSYERSINHYSLQGKIGRWFARFPIPNPHGKGEDLWSKAEVDLRFRLAMRRLSGSRAFILDSGALEPN